MAKKRPKKDPFTPFPQFAAARAAQRAPHGNRRWWLAGGGAATLAIIGGAGWLFQSSGQAAAVDLDADVLTLDRSAIDLGRVALNVVVPVVVRLTNQSRRTVALGQPTAEALEGC